MDQVVVYKGKVTNRSWAQLPEGLVRHIITDYLYTWRAPVPHTWESRHAWQSRNVWSAIRDAQEIERLMVVCPQWGRAIETHPFWHQAISVFDPLDYLGNSALLKTNSNSSSAHTPYRHFRQLLTLSCLICRLNHPHTYHGLGTSRRTYTSYYLGYISICRDHDRGRPKYCGLCLRDAAPYGADPDNRIGVCENEDEDVWPGVETTCRTCRLEWLLGRMRDNPKDYEALGGRNFESADYEVRSTVENFLDLAEGSIEEVIVTGRERAWLRKHTRLADMLSQAVLAVRYDPEPTATAAREVSPALSMDFSDISDAEAYAEIDAEMENDAEFLSLTENDGVRDLALNDWARNRILDGFWISPADQYYASPSPMGSILCRTVHPAPWTKETVADESGSEHPSSEIVSTEIPPTFSLTEQAFHAHRRTLASTLLPAMKNIVRRLVIECGADNTDPALKASKMSLEEVCKGLGEEGVWWEGVDWLERRRNERESDDSSNESKSDGSSPVLSTTTLGTTPSPPPLTDEKKESASPLSRPLTIPISPILNPPRLLPSIPYVPVTTQHMPFYSLEAFKAVWREACAPLYHCRCRICERAMEHAANVAAGNQAKEAKEAKESREQPVQQIVIPEPSGSPPVVEIKLGSPEPEDRSLTEVDNEEVYESEEASSRSLSPEIPYTRKRSVDEIEPEEMDTPGKTVSADAKKDLVIRISPSKKPRRDIDSLSLKRSSEELELEDASRGKRFKLSPELSESPPDDSSSVS